MTNSNMGIFEYKRSRWVHVSHWRQLAAQASVGAAAGTVCRCCDRAVAPSLLACPCKSWKVSVDYRKSFGSHCWAPTADNTAPR